MLFRSGRRSRSGPAGRRRCAAPSRRRTPPSTRQAARQAHRGDRKSTRLNSSHTEIYTLSLHDALPIWTSVAKRPSWSTSVRSAVPSSYSTVNSPGGSPGAPWRSEEHTSELQSHRDLHSFPTRCSSDLDVGREAAQLVDVGAQRRPVVVLHRQLARRLARRTV